jgi:hypothetical protein
MLRDVGRVRAAFDELQVGNDAAFCRLLEDGRLRHADVDGAPDFVDLLDSRLLCSALRSSEAPATLVVFPDGAARRSPLLFAAALVMDAVAHIGAGPNRRVLYLSNHAGIRNQLANVRVGTLSLDGVFAQQHGKGRAQELRTVSLPGGVHLPAVLSVCSPADPASLLRGYLPKWVAVDCSEALELEWLPALLREARRLGIPVCGWTARPFSDVVAQWSKTGGGVLRWPRRREGVVQRVETLEQLSSEAVSAEVTPRVLAGEHVHEVSLALVTASEALLAARHLQQGRLSTDATALGWRYLRAIEALSVPVDVYEREAPGYWGVRRLAELRSAFERFVGAVESVSSDLHAHLVKAADAISTGLATLMIVDPPLWLGVANLCIESGRQRRIVFSSKSRRDMFGLCLLGRFNMSETDLHDVGVSLDYLGRDQDDVAFSPEAAVEEAKRHSATCVFVGLPSRFAERRLDTLFGSQRIEFVLWPHQERVLAYRLRALAAGLTMSSHGLGSLLPGLEETAGPGNLAGSEGALRVVANREVVAGAVHDELQRRSAAAPLWTRPDAAEAITSLFETLPSAEDAEEEVGTDGPLLDDLASTIEVSTPPEDAWVPEAHELWFEGGRRLLLARNDTVNVIVRTGSTAQIEETYIRAVRPGDEVLYIHGQKRQSLYDLLVSRVHRDRVIAEYLALIRHWQDDLVRSFAEAHRRLGLTPERLLSDLQARGSRLTSSQTIRTWLRRLVLAPHDVEDLRRVAEVLSMPFVTAYFRQVHKAARRLKGLHINLSARLNRWLASSDAGSVAVGEADDVVDSELGLTVEDFRHSLVRLRVIEVRHKQGPFYRPHMGRLEGGDA